MFNKIKSFFDDPVSKFYDWYRHMAQRQMRKAIDLKYDKKISNQVFWITTTKDENQGLSDDNIERLSQRMILSQCGYLIAQRLWAKRTFIIFPILFILGVLFCYWIFITARTTSNEYFLSIITSICFLIGIALMLGGYILAPFTAQFLLPNRALKDDEIKTVENTVKRCLVKDLDKDTPPDFTDRLRILDVDKNGHAVAGQILARDVEYSALKDTWYETAKMLFVYGIAFLSPAIISIFPNIAIIAYLAIILLAMRFNPFKTGFLAFIFLYFIIPSLMFYAFNGYSVSPGNLIAGKDIITQQVITTTPGFLVWGFCLICWFIAFLLTIYSKSPLRSRAEILEQAVKQTGTELLIDKAGIGYFKNLEMAKEKQIQNAKADESEFIELGKSTSIFAQRRDPFSPTEPNIPMGLTINDLSTHLFTLGASGTGKTTGVIRPIAHKWLELNKGGMFALDGKFSLPLELADLTPNFVLISPDKEKFNPIANMSPDSVADIIAEICNEDSSESDPFWSNSASLMLRMASIVIKYSSKPYTLNNIYDFCTSSDQERNKLLTEQELKDLARTNRYVYSALHYWLKEFPDIPEKTAGTISNMVRTWLGQITSHEILGSWVDTDQNNVDIENIFIGAKMGLLLPQSEYGQGGLIISALVMRRIYDQAKRRGDQWKNNPEQKPVVLIADEVQNLLTQADLENVPIARSLGLYLVFATQNLDGLYKRLEEEGAKQMIGNFASLIALPPRTEDSNKYLSQRVGKIYKSTVERFEGLPDARADISLFLESGTDQVIRQTNLFNQAIIGHPRLSYLVGQSFITANLDGSPKEEFQQNSSASPTLNIKIVDLIEPEELDSLLAVPQSAVAIFNRGRVVRRDVINLGFIGGK